MNRTKFKQYVKEALSEVRRAYKLYWVIIIPRFVKNCDYYMAIEGEFPIPVIYLYIDEQSRKFGRKAIRGIIAHEIAHFYTADERKADLIALKAGFQKHLEAFHKAHNEIYEEYEHHEGMTLKEIQNWKP